MKYFNKRTLLLSLTVIMGYLSLNNSGGAGAGATGVDATGSPFGTTCASSGACHNQSPGSFTPVVTMQLLDGITPVTSYVPGTTYTLVITTTSPGTTASTGYGFQAVSVQASSYNNTGIWTTPFPADVNTAVVNGRIYAEQDATLTSNTVNLAWIAPAAGTGTVNFYASGIIVNSDLLATGDNSNNDSLIIHENIPCTVPISVIPSTTSLTCNNSNNGAINITVSGGNPPYSYSWTGPNGFTDTMQNIANLAAGTYTVTVTAGNCVENYSVTLANPTLLADSASSEGSTCEGNTLTLLGFATGGTGTIVYSWTGPNGFADNTQNPTIPQVTLDDSGVYTLVVTDDNGCSQTTTTDVTINPGVVLSANTTDPVCSSTPSGAIDLTVSGDATPPYAFSWTGPNGFTSSSQSLTNLTGGIYTVTVTPAAGCDQTYTAVLNTPTAITVNATANTLTPCQGTILALSGSGSGGTGALHYQWTGPNGYFTINQIPPPTVNVGFAASGTYTLMATDANGCTASSPVTIKVDTVPTVAITPIAAACFGTSSGSVQIIPTGGAPFSYSWTGPNSYTATTQNISNIPIGTYSVTVTATGGCSTTKTATVTQPATPVSGFASSNSPICNDGTLNLFGGGSGGTGGISYSWTGPNGFTSTSENPSISSVTSLGTGLYTLTMKDANNCTYTASTNVALSPLPYVTATATDITCNGSNTGAITTQVLGGAPPFSYTWTGPNGYMSNASNPANLGVGTYTVTVSGVCAGLTTASATVSQPAAIFDSAYANSPVCAGTPLSLNSIVSGGVGNFSYSWTGPNNFISTSPSMTIPAATTAGTGIYTLLVRDGNNCLKASQVHVTVDTVPSVNINDTGYCAASSVTLDAGNTGASYLWSTGATTQTINVSAAGSYNVIVTNAYGCPSVKSVQVVAYNMPSVDSIIATVTSGNPGGYNFTAANAQSVTGYLWDFGDGSTYEAVAPVHYYPAADTYTVKLYAANMCGVDTITKQIVVAAVTGVQNVVNNGNSVSVYPNPTRDYVVIESGNQTLKSVKVINVLGDKIYESSINNQQSFRMNTNTFVPGIYTLYIETSEGTAVRKLEVMK